MTDSYDIGDRRTFTAKFTDTETPPAPKNPTTVTVSIRNPDGVVTNPVAANPAVGTFTVDFEFAIPGRHIINFLGDGAVNAAKEIEVWARRKGA